MDKMLITGRLVQGHPMRGRPDLDDTTKQQKTNKMGELQFQFYFAVAIPKRGEQGDKGWQQTEWGNFITGAGVAGWPNGEHQRPNFAWKIVDGDSNIPDQNGNPPCSKEGWPGHWIVKFTNGYSTPSYHAGRLTPQDVIMNEAEIKCGDYVRVQFSALGNGPVNKSPGVYLNPNMFELARAGQMIMSAAAPNAAEAFGQSEAQLPQNGQYDQGVQNPAANMQAQQQPVQQQAQQQPVQQQAQQQPVQQQAQQQPVQQQAQQQPVQQQAQQQPQGFEQAPQNFLNNGQL